VVALVLIWGFRGPRAQLLLEHDFAGAADGGDRVGGAHGAAGVHGQPQRGGPGMAARDAKWCAHSRPPAATGMSRASQAHLPACGDVALLALTWLTWASNG
jgi:hypothetical protein